MRSSSRIAAESSWLYRLLTLGPGHVSLTDDTLLIGGSAGRGPREISVGAMDSIVARPSLFGHRLDILLGDGTNCSIGGLAEDEALNLRNAVIEVAGRVVKIFSPELERLEERLRHSFDGDRYARYRNSHELYVDIARTLKGCRGLAREQLAETATTAIGRLAPHESVENFERARKRANNLFISKRVPAVKKAARETLRNPLTNEQAQTVATDDDATLVLAGAGTGKTSVIVGKVAHLVRNENASPQEILVLAFNRKAAGEIRDRLKGDLSAAHVQTFHSFGRRVISEVELAPTISKYAEDELKLRQAIEEIIGDLLNDPGQSRAVFDFISRHHASYRSAFDFKSLYEYEEYVRGVELRTLSGDLVKSFEELEIANYLTEHGVEFEYERPYKAATATQHYRQYQPDFYLPNHQIYIEHFALDHHGEAPPGWKDYAKGVEWKRNIHRENGTRLVETHSWQYRGGILLETLRGELEEAGVRFNQIPRQELVRQLSGEQISRLAGLLATFLNHVRSGNLAPGTLRARAQRIGDRRRSSSFLNVFEQVRARYQELLVKEEALDFHDLINLAAEHIREGRWRSEYRYVLVDEFQDISSGRMALLQALQGRDVAYFLVGDDWQSINRFTGSDVGIMRKCGDLLGHVEERTLSRTFRFADGILRPSSAFVKRNREQTQRQLLSASEAEDEGIAIVFDSSPERGVRRALLDIEAKASGQQTVLVLGRYNRGLRALRGSLRKGSITAETSTVHGAKGREADFAIVLDLCDGRWGFPSKVEDDPLLEVVLPPASGGAYEFAEERRLFYVAMTRARNGAYLVVDPVKPSTFVTELIAAGADELRQIGELARKCPRCSMGRLRLSQSAKNLLCAVSSCGHRAPSCPNCHSGYALVEEGRASCTNQACGLPATICPKCRRGVLLKKAGKFGPFSGCTEFWSIPSCEFTQSIG